MSTTSGVSSTTSATSTSTPANSLNTMTGSDFVKVMLTQLQHQDPLNPQDSGQLLTQMSDIASLQTNQTLSSTLTGMTLQQSVGSGANMIGKTVDGVDATGAAVHGTVTSVSVQGQAVSLQLDSNATLPIGNVTSITNAVAAAQASTATTAATTAATDPSSTYASLAQLFAGLSGSSNAQAAAAAATAAAATSPNSTAVAAASGSGGTAATK